MSQVVQNVEIQKRIAELLEERDLITAAIKQGLSQPESVNIVGSVSYTNRDLDKLRKQRNDIDIQLATIRNGTSITMTLPKYWRQNGAGGYVVR